MSRIHPLLALLLLATTARAEKYTGAQACGACHPAVLASWQKTAHARPFDPNAPAGCQGCHATSSRLPGVQCEACHGPGAAYAPDDVMRDRALARALGLRDLSSSNLAAACGRCHRAALSPRPFDAVAAWKKIAH